ncbi:MAG: N-acetyl-gamma-glutamyl-phosphate reductase [Lachnospiraceae bacterium]|nr:N-acetyl-gamma-glutamyl-phosphate reductase [Lachnospiraceae bacterium]
MAKKVFVDGSEGTTGLRIFERFEGRNDIEILKIDSELRKDPTERAKLINASDVTFLCLPDAAAIEAVSLCTNPDTIIIDTSTAHRTSEGWTYGFPELDKEHRDAVKASKRIANPGCHASGFVSLVYPLVKSGMIPADTRLCCFSLTGYSGGGKKKIAEYQSEDRDPELCSPRQYGLGQNHKHLKEMQKICGLEKAPMFSPIICDFYSGMEVSVYLYREMFDKEVLPETLNAFYQKYYEGSKLVRVTNNGIAEELGGFIGSNNLSGKDYLEIIVTGNEDRIVVTSRFDNLGKGASAAAVQSMNIALGFDETTGLVTE